MRKALLLLPLLSLTAANRAAHAETAVPEPPAPEPEAAVTPPVAEAPHETGMLVAGDPLAKDHLWKALEEGNVAMLDAAIQGGADVLQTRDGGKTPLMVAARAGSGDMVTRLLAAGAEVDTADENGYTALAHAVEGRDIDTVQLLLDAQASPNVVNAKGETPIFRLCSDFRYLHRGIVGANAVKNEPIRRARLLRLIGLLLDKGADPNLFSASTCSPLTMAARFGETAAVDLLLKSGADAGGRTQTAIEQDRLREAGISEVADKADAEAKRWETPLQAVLNGGRRALVERLFITDGGTIGPSERDELRRHAEASDLAIVNRLIAAGAKLSKGMDRFCLLDASCGTSAGSSRLEVVKRLTEAGALVKTDDMARRVAMENPAPVRPAGGARLVEAAMAEKPELSSAAKPKPQIVETVTVPISLKVSVPDCIPDTPRPVPGGNLVAARPQMSQPRQETRISDARAAKFHITGVKVLSPDFKPREVAAATGEERPVYVRTETFARLAPQTGQKPAAKPIRGLDAAKSFDAFYGVPKGFTPLVQAARAGDVETVKYLLENGADPNHIDAEGKTPLMHVCGAGRLKWVRELPAQRAQALVQVTEEDPRSGTRVVSYAEKNQWREWAEDGDLEIVRALLKAGAAVDARDLNGRTPLMYAARCSSTEIVRELIKGGASVNAQDKVGKTALMQVIGGGRYSVAPKWISPLLRGEAEAAQDKARREESFATTNWAQQKVEQYQLHRDLIMQEAERDDSLVLCELRRAGTDLTLRDTQGRTAMDMALAAGQQHAVRWLMGEVY